MLSLFSAQTRKQLYQKTPIQNQIIYLRKNRLPLEILTEIDLKNQLRRRWQRFHDPQTKRLLNSKINSIRLMLHSHRQDEWDKFLDSPDHNQGSLFKLNKQVPGSSSSN